MKVISFNANGIRAAARKGFFDWLKQENADVVCVQETKAVMSEITDAIYYPEGYHCHYYDACKKGYSGVAIFSRQQPDHLRKGLGFEHADEEGRYIQADFGSLSVVSLYMPSGSSGEHRQKIKFDFMSHFMPILQKLRHGKRSFIICGDWNIVHKEIDIKNFKGNQKNSGCLPEERAWLDELFVKVGFVDAFRVLNQQAEQYTWWSHRGQAYAKNVGWRIDYEIVTPDLKDKIKSVKIYKDQRFSDHAPLIIDYDL
jgi:exodeoxyribonuclease-3